jgi:hypothetical protein
LNNILGSSQLKRLSIAALFVIAALLSTSHSTSAQSSQSVYWRYDAPDRLSHIVVADLDRDGIDDIVVVAGNSEVVLVGADGIAKWSVPYRTEAPITDIAISNLEKDFGHGRQILVLTEAGLAALDSNRKEYFATSFREKPALVRPISAASDAPNNSIVAFDDGELRQFDGEGNLLWEHTFPDVNERNAQPVLVVADLDRDGLDEIIYSYFTNQGFSKLVMLSPDGNLLWERSNSGNVNALTVVDFDPEKPREIALATSLDRVFLYSADGSRRWPYRSPNKSITALEPAILNGTPALVVGTSVGKLIAYDESGRRIWEGTYNSTPDRPILSISSSPEDQSGGNPVALSVLIGPAPDSTEAADIILLDAGGRRLEPSFPAIDSAALSRLVDVNNDGLVELLLAGFATAELLDPGVGARHYSSTWDYRLDAGPQAFVVTDLDLDNEQEILIGTDGGTVQALKNNGTRLWSAELGGIISDIGIAAASAGAYPYIAVIHNDSTVNSQEVVVLEGWLELLDHDGHQLWSKSLPSTITAMVIGDINRSGPPEIVVGTSDGLILAFSLAGDEFWRSSVTASVDALTLSSNEEAVEIIAATGANKIDRLDNKGTGFDRTAEYLDEIIDISILTRDPELDQLLVVAVEDGTLRGLSPKGNQRWQVDLPGSPLLTHPADESILVGTDEEQLLRIDIDGEIEWRHSETGFVTSLYWGDLDGDVVADIAVGNREGDVRLITADGEKIWDELNLDSEVVAVSAIGRLPDLQADLVAITDNGIVRLFQSSANRPPLLVNPQTEVSEGNYSISVSVIDVEEDPVKVTLELYDPDTEQWELQGEKTASGGSGTLFWPVDPPEDASEIRYRFQYNDGSHSAIVEPAAGPAAIPASPILVNVLVILFFAIVGTGGVALYIRQARSPGTKARRFYKQLKNNPERTLKSLNEEFNRTGGSAYFLLNLANAARQDHDRTLTSLADGLYLLGSRPESALRIILGALEEAEQASLNWKNHASWQQFYETALYFISAPTVTELTLLRSKLEQLVEIEQSEDPEVQQLDELMPVLNSLRDSLRVDMVEDRLMYLSEAIGVLKQLRHRKAQYSISIEHSLVDSIINRWIGLVRIELEETHGRAQLDIQLLTKRLVPEKEPLVALEMTGPVCYRP